MGKKYNYYDTPHNDPETVKYRGWENVILLIGIGVVSTLLMLHHFFADSNPVPPPPEQSIVEQAPIDNSPDCEAVNMIHVQERDRLTQLLSIANELPIEHVSVNIIGSVCYEDSTPIYDTVTDIMVVVGYTPAAAQSDYDTLGNHVASLLPPMMQIHPDVPRDLIIHFLVGDTYLEWKHSYHQTALHTQNLRGEALWFWTE